MPDKTWGKVIVGLAILGAVLGTQLSEDARSIVFIVCWVLFLIGLEMITDPRNQA